MIAWICTFVGVNVCRFACTRASMVAMQCDALPCHTTQCCLLICTCVMHSMHACMYVCMSGLLEFLDAGIQVCIVLDSDVLCCNVLKCMEYIYAWMHAFTCAFFFDCMYVCQCMFFFFAGIYASACICIQATPHTHTQT